MIDWTAVVIGFLVELVLGAIGFAAPGVGQVAAALVGGFVAGYLAGGGLASGGWHGLLAGALGGLVLALVLGVFGSALLGVVTGGPGALLGLGITAFAVLLVFVVSIPSAIAGALGGAL